MICDHGGPLVNKHSCAECASAGCVMPQVCAPISETVLVYEIQNSNSPTLGKPK